MSLDLPFLCNLIFRKYFVVINFKVGLSLFVALFMSFMLFTQSAKAEDDNNITYEAGITAVALDTTDKRIKNEETASADLYLHWQRPNGMWTLYLEGNTTPLKNGVSAILGESNADAGTALDERRQGRIQISSLYYTYDWDTSHSLTAGMIDASVFLDVSRIANDQNSQFLGVSFVNNPTIEFSDYALGFAYEQKLESAGMPVVRFVLTSSNGLANNTNVSYNQLLSIDEPNKGAFAAARAGWKIENALFNMGIWTHTAPHTALDNSTKTNLKNYGAYLVAGVMHEKHALNLRLGVANPEVSRASAFAGLSYRYKADPWVSGIAYALIKVSSHVVPWVQIHGTVKPICVTS
jgi:hypothetical protein